MKLALILILGFSFNVFAENQPGEPAGEIISGEPTGSDDSADGKLGNSDCEKKLMQLALGDKAPSYNPATKKIEDGTARLLPTDPNPRLVAAVSDDPFGSPCRFR